MVAINPFRSGTAILMTLSILSAAGAPVLMTLPTQAAQPQLFSQSGRARVAEGTVIPVSYDKERILLKPGESMEITLKVDRNITSTSGTILIPRGSTIEGELQPTDDDEGVQFVARELILRNGQRYDLDATSDVVTRREKLRRDANTASILQGAAIGAAASAILSEVFGDIGFLKVLAGAGLGAAGGFFFGRKTVEVISVEPETDLDLTLESDLVLR